ncbi:MAG: hypothetical protein K5751_14025 [Treponemataceae bacterium]|nr:hypothetical protein [Treponemataceae bacterium]
MGKRTRILEQIKAGELPASEYAEFSDTNGSNLFTEISALEESDREILAAYPASAMQAAVAAKLSGSKFTKKHFSWNIQHIIACAAVLCFALMIPFFVKKGSGAKMADIAAPGEGITLGAAVDESRAKGVGTRMYLYKKVGEDAVKLSDSDSVSAGDIIQISYIASGAKYGAIVSVDGNGVVTQHYPEYGYTSALLETNGEIPLDYSYQLDDAPSFERFLLITGDKPFTVSGIVDAVDSFDNKNMSIKADFSKYLPKNLKITELLLLKK